MREWDKMGMEEKKNRESKVDSKKNNGEKGYSALLRVGPFLDEA